MRRCEVKAWLCLMRDGKNMKICWPLRNFPYNIIGVYFAMIPPSSWHSKDSLLLGIQGYILKTVHKQFLFYHSKIINTKWKISSFLTLSKLSVEIDSEKSLFFIIFYTEWVFDPCTYILTVGYSGQNKHFFLHDFIWIGQNKKI